ncbi:hypothetical protein EDB81DRAFT_344578 [Dactylonectria macrodidyma]|uniref:Uncharacterized protein n=1 Tax=Dactylonectria macrodidyma TaxID=307937 RepID=A0A9P9FEK4_9HYPO|nr:hypothetical protein EDB81DRAFT_344578 [Dactylonectria macrodidyma]
MPLQKSYSEYVGVSKNRSPWQRSKSNPVFQTPKSKPLRPVSEVTKSKLNQFQYKPNADDAVAGNSNLEQLADGVSTEAQRPSPLNGSKDDNAVTPVTRLTWRDLVEPMTTTEDETHISPNDRLLWDNRQDTLYISALSPMLARKGRKRARSSSPISSPAADKPNPPSVNVKKLAQALKSPHADPTLELWDRYSLNGSQNANTPLSITNPALAQLMVSSSPRPSKGPAGQLGEGNLRRAISCGLNYPKRRKVERSISGGRGSGEKEDREAASKSSFVTALLDTVTSSINGQSQAEIEEQTGESPSPKKRRRSATSGGSPCRVSQNPPKPTSSDYGDDDFDDFDDDTMLELEASINATQLETPATSRSAVNTTGGEHTQTEPMAAEEFDDLDDDIFDEAEELITTVESQHIPQAPDETPRPSTKNKLTTVGNDLGDLDDEFGDAFGGDFDFEAVELAATQAAKQSHATPGDVR